MASKWVNGQHSLGQKYRGRMSLIQKTLYSWWNGKNADPNSKTDDYVKHIFWKHNQKAEHWATLPAEGQRKTVVDRYSNSESWKAVKSFWDASATDNGKSECGVVIKGVDRDRWVTIIKIAVPLKAGTAMAAEVKGVCVLTEILDLVFNKCLCVQSINRCTDTIRVRTTAGCERHNHGGIGRLVGAMEYIAFSGWHETGVERRRVLQVDVTCDF